MPGFTPNFAIEYPCAGETINAAVFQTFADDVEAALAAVDTLSAAALQRPRAAMRRTTAQVIPSGVTTAISWQVNDFVSGVTAAAAGFTIVTSGIYLVTFECQPFGAPASLTSQAGEFQVAGATWYKRKLSENPTTNLAQNFNLTGMIQATAGQLVSFHFGWTGSVANIDFFGRATICKLSDL